MKSRLALSAIYVLSTVTLAFGQTVHDYDRKRSIDWVKELSDQVQRNKAADALGIIAGQVQNAFRKQSKAAAENQFPANRGMDIRRMKPFTTPMKTVVPALAAAANAKQLDAESRRKLQAVLNSWQDLADEAVKDYRGFLKDPDFAPIMFAAEALGEMGPLAKDAVDDLQKQSMHPDNRVREAVATALKEIQKGADAGDPRRLKSVQDTVKLMTDRNTSVRWKAAKALGPLSAGDQAAAKIAVPALIKALDDYDNYVRQMAVESLQEIGGSSKSAVPALEKRLKVERDNDVIKAIRTALPKIQG